MWDRIEVFTWELTVAPGSMLCARIEVLAPDRRAVSAAIRPGRTSGICCPSVLVHRLAGLVDAMALVHQTIEDHIGERRLAMSALADYA